MDFFFFGVPAQQEHLVHLPWLRSFLFFFLFLAPPRANFFPYLIPLLGQLGHGPALFPFDYLDPFSSAKPFRQLLRVFTHPKVGRFTLRDAF